MITVAIRSIFFLVIILLPAGLAFAEPIEVTFKPVNLNLDMVDQNLVKITDVKQLGFVAGVEYRDSTSTGAYPAVEDTSTINGLFSVDSLKNSEGQTILRTFLNDTWKMTATYTSLSDYIYETDSFSYFKYSTMTAVGVLTFYVSTDMAVIPTPATGLGYTDGTIVAQFAVYNPNGNLGGVVNTVNPFDGSRDLLFLQLPGSGISGFITSTNDNEEITVLTTDQNIEVENNGDINPVNSFPNDPVPTNWPYPVDSPPVTYPVDFFTENDGSFRFGSVPRQDEPGACRMTGGGNDVNGNLVIGTEASSLDDRYTYGGQVGAPTLAAPGPYGEWTHHQQSGLGDRFIFHSGTHSAPLETKILNVLCQDECNCVQARPAPFKQISWDGIGTFKNISPAGLEQLLEVCNAQSPSSLNRGQSKKNPSPSNGEQPPVVIAGNNGTLHYYRVHVNDIGEPGSGGVDVNRGKGKKSTRTDCALYNDGVLDGGMPNFPYTDYLISEEDCANCPDTYQIEIYCTDEQDVASNTVMYSVGAFVEGGNLQIHPPVGDHLKPGTCGVPE